VKWDISDINNWKNDQHLMGAVIPEAGNARQYKTGGWRTEKPLWKEEKCTHCFICWVYCPDSSIQVKDDKMIGIDLDHCKGCGICAVECPKDAIELVAEE
jgi:pyruvate ferredoxin oxidoreductase delta subunit